jgi:hypothetical protein
MIAEFIVELAPIEVQLPGALNVSAITRPV